jgi:hypothetical protein
MKRSLPLSLCGATIALMIVAPQASAQRVNTHSNTERGGVEVKQVPGRKIGNVTTRGNLIELELDSGVIGDHNLFDLDKRTLRFTPTATGFRAENVALQWDAAIGQAIQGNSVRLTKFSFPFSGKSWDSLQVLTTGLVTFGGGYNDIGFDRFVHMKDAGPGMVNKIPVIAAFFKLRMNGTRYVNELADRVVLTWDVSEPTSGQQDVTFARTPHHFQAVLHRDGRVDLSYQEMTAHDGVVGVYTVPPGGAPPTQPVDFSSLKSASAPKPAIFESFHHYGLPGSESMACTVIQALGDRFDFMVWYSDFRVDDQEAGTRSVGDIGQKVQGIGPRMDQGMRLSDYCSQGRLQVTWFQPVWVGSVQAQERHPDGRFPGYNMAVAQIGHELAHRWSTRSRAISVQPPSGSINHGRFELEGQRRRHVHNACERYDEPRVRILVLGALLHGIASGVEGAGLLHAAQSTKRWPNARRQCDCGGGENSHHHSRYHCAQWAARSGV